MRFRLLWPIVALTGGVVFCCLGILCVGAYVVEAVWATAGLPDRSPLFWYLPVLFMGFFLFSVGLTAGEIDTISVRMGGCPDDDKEDAFPLCHHGIFTCINELLPAVCV